MGQIIGGKLDLTSVDVEVDVPVVNDSRALPTCLATFGAMRTMVMHTLAHIGNMPQ